jgi:precorrin-6B methylase 1
MDTLVFHTEADRIEDNLLQSIKAYFGNMRVEISVKPEKKSLSELIEQNRNSKISYIFEGDSFDEVASKILNDEPVDFEPYKQEKP